MKYWKSSIVLLSILLVLSTLHAATLEHLRITTGNDWVSLGVGNSKDDGLSYSIHLIAQWDTLLELRLDVVGLTDQAHTDRRYDIAQLMVRRAHHLYEAGPWSIDVTPFAGLLLSGNLGFQGAQNLLHTIVNRQKVFLEYELNYPLLHPTVGLEPQLRFDSDSHALSLSTTMIHTPRWENSVDLLLQWGYQSTFTAGVGYEAVWGATPFQSQELLQVTYRGLYLSSTYNGSLFGVTYRTYLTSGFSYGTFGVNVLSLSRPKTYRSRDLTVSSGLFYDLNGFHTYLSSLTIRGVTIETRYSNGVIEPGEAYRRHRRNIAMWSVGYRWEFGSDTAIVHPSIGLYGGVKRFNLTKNYSEVLIDTYRAAVGIETSLALGRREAWIIENTSYSLRFALGLQYVLGPPVPSVHPKYDKFSSPWMLLLGIVLDIDHDLT